jgi:DNA modification methylase
VYEVALFFSIGDRKITTAVNNVFPFPGRKDSNSRHQSEKPWQMLSHFFRMFVDETTSVLDPCCGSATSLIAAEKLGATTIFGMDKDPETVETAQNHFNIHRFGA